MPIAKKQTATSRPKKKTGGIHDKIQPVKPTETGLRMSIYGRGKTGKTRFVTTYPKPMLLVATEDGTKSLGEVPGLDMIRLEASEELDQVIEVLTAADNIYKSVAIDHASGLQDIILKEVLGIDDIPVQRSWGMAKREQWSTCGIQVKERLRLLFRLSETHGINVGVVAHERSFKDEEGDSDLLFPTVGSALSPSVAGWLNGAVDYICQTYIREETISRPVVVAGKQTTISEKTGVKEFCLRIGPHPVYMTGFRCPPGIELPESIVDPSYDKVIELIKG